MRVLFSLLALAYIICPYDLIPDFFLGMGWIDDLIILPLVLWYFFYHRKRQYGYGGYHKNRGRSSSAEESGKEPYEEEGTGHGYDHKEKSSPGGGDPRSVLGVARDAPPEEIKRTYRRLANQYHPDKVNHLGREFRELAERRFKEIQKAYQELMVK
ncbi:MAG: DnaJ domain-containing protein [Thermodesulfobacteriota bacterium]|nr:DnaJ domain-containing protein [Thermodesulfobacteriota bacterium]